MAVPAELLMSALADCDCGTQGGGGGRLTCEPGPADDVPLTSEPPLAQLPPLTSEPPLSIEPALTSEPPLTAEQRLTSESPLTPESLSGEPPDLADPQE